MEIKNVYINPKIPFRGHLWTQLEKLDCPAKKGAFESVLQVVHDSTHL